MKSENVLDILEGHGTSIPFIFAAYFKCAKIKGARKKGSIFKIIFSLGSALSRSNFIISRTRVEIYADIFIALISYFSNESLSLYPSFGISEVKPRPLNDFYQSNHFSGKCVVKSFNS